MTIDQLEAERAVLWRAYVSGTTRVTYDGKTVEYGSGDDMLARIRTIDREIAALTKPLPVAGLAGFLRGDR